MCFYFMRAAIPRVDNTASRTWRSHASIFHLFTIHGCRVLLST